VGDLRTEVTEIKRQNRTLNQPIQNLLILGSSGLAREVAWLVTEINSAGCGNWNVIGFWSDRDEDIGQLINGFPVLSREDIIGYIPNLSAVAAIGNPDFRKRAVDEATRLGCRFPSLVHPNVRYDMSTVQIGQGSIICARNVLTVNIVIGAHVLINLGCTVGHDCVLEDFVTISPGCHLSGHTVIRERAFLGSSVTTIEWKEVGSRAVIGAGATVTTDIPPGVIATGLPAKVTRKRDSMEI
jgi:sugar O-acyltransferase (sialic acid O-acetyltransferase NeuD family)